MIMQRIATNYYLQFAKLETMLKTFAILHAVPSFMLRQLQQSQLNFPFLKLIQF